MRMPRLSLGRRKQRLPLQLVPAPCSQQRRPPLAPYSLPLLSSWARRWSAGPTGSGESRCVGVLQDTRAQMLVACVRALTYAYDHGHASHVLPCAIALSLCALTRPRAERGLTCSSHRMATRAITFRRSVLCWKLDRRAGSSCGGQAGCRSSLTHTRRYRQFIMPKLTHSKIHTGKQMLGGLRPD